MEKQIRSITVLIGGYFLAYIVLGMTTATLGPALPYLARNVSTSLRGISSLFIGHRLGYMIGSFVGGHLYDRISGNRLMAGMLLIMAAGMIATPVIPILSLLVVIVFLHGIAEGTVDVGGNVLLVWIKPPKIGSLMNALHLFFGLGALISPLILAQVIRHTGGIRCGYWIIAAQPSPKSSGGPGYRPCCGRPLFAARARFGLSLPSCRRGERLRKLDLYLLSHQTTG